MIWFRFKCVSKQETSWSPLVSVQFNASQQEPFGAATPSVTFQASMVPSAANLFVLGREYDFNATESPCACAPGQSCASCDPGG